MKSLYLRIYRRWWWCCCCSRWPRAGSSSATSSRSAGAPKACGARAHGRLGRTDPALAAAARRAARGQAEALRDWSQRLRLPLALDTPAGAAHRRVGQSSSAAQRHARRMPTRLAVRQARGRPHAVDDAARPARPARSAPRRGDVRGERPRPLPPCPAARPGARRRPGAVLVVLFIAVAAGAYPVVRRLTRRLEALKQRRRAVRRRRAGPSRRDHGRDEVAAVAVELQRRRRPRRGAGAVAPSLLANASHELRSPLARMKMAVSMLDERDAGAARALEARRSTPTSPSSTRWSRRCCWRAGSTPPQRSRRATGSICWRWPPRRRRGSDAAVDGASASRRRRRAPAAPRPAQPARERPPLRRRASIEVRVESSTAGGAGARCSVCDRGPGVPEAMRERIFEPFFRLPGPRRAGRRRRPRA